MSQDKMREEFEAACKRHAIEAGYPELDHGFERLSEDRSCYSDTHTQAAWWAWQASHEAAGWQPMETCPKHVEVLFYREDCGVISGNFTCADTFMTRSERESGKYSDEEQFREDAWCYGPDGVERLDGDLMPTHWMPYPAEPGVQS